MVLVQPGQRTCALLPGGLVKKLIFAMNSDPQNSSPEPPDDGVMSPEQFQAWIREPGNQEKFYELVAKLNLPVPPDAPPELAAKLRSLAERSKVVLALAPFKRKLDALMEVMQRPGGTLRAEDRLAQCQKLMEEATNALLDVPEPHRTHHFKQLLPLREKILAMRVD